MLSARFRMVDRFFMPDGCDPALGRVELEPDESRHAVRSLRVRDGDAVELLDGEGLVVRGRFESTRKSGCVVEVLEVERRGRTGPEVHLALSVPRGPRMDSVVEAATALGVRTIRPVVFSRSVAVREETPASRLARWQRLVREAVKQSGEPFAPAFEPALPLDAWLAAPRSGRSLLMHPDPAAPSLARALGASGAVTLLIGPEGGLVADELAAARAAGVEAVRLGDALLRIELAAVAAMAIARLR